MHSGEIKKAGVIQWLARVAKQAELVASVCTGAFLLAEAGILTTQQVTTHWEDIPDLARFRQLLGKPPGPKCGACPLP